MVMIGDGYWKNYENVKNEMDKLTNKLGHYPTQKELKETDTRLYSSIEKTHGGHKKFKGLVENLRKNLTSGMYSSIPMPNNKEDAEKIIDILDIPTYREFLEKRMERAVRKSEYYVNSTFINPESFGLFWNGIEKGVNSDQ